MEGEESIYATYCMQTLHFTLTMARKRSNKNKKEVIRTSNEKRNAIERNRTKRVGEVFETLRVSVPYCDEKRSKFKIIEMVIKYIRYLQDELNKHENCMISPQLPQQQISSSDLEKEFQLENFT